jgi:signal transduction histidine kinase
MMVANMAKFGDRAEFRADMVRGMEGCAKKLHALVDRVRPGRPSVDAPQPLDPANAVLEVVDVLDRSQQPVRAQIGEKGLCVHIAPSDLRAILMHLVTNAVEASEGGDEVLVGLRRERANVVIDIVDKGRGMSPEFVRSSLFVPLRSTKTSGHGIGAYQARHLVRAAGGDLEVLTALGRGTTMRVVLPTVADMAEPICEGLVG